MLLLGACSHPAAAQLTAAPQASGAVAAEPVADRIRDLNAIFHDYWQNYLKHSPEFASTIGDHRYDDQLSDYSVDAYNDQLENGLRFITRLGAIDTTGMPEEEQLSKRLLVHDLIDQQEEAPCKPWETPVNQFSGIQVDLPALVEMLQFKTVDDYNNYVTRLKAVPHAFYQVSYNMELGTEQHNTEPKYLMEKVLVEVNSIAAEKPEDTPFAEPLKHFPASISAAQQAQIRDTVLAAIRTQVLPSYAHFAKFLAAIYIPASRTGPGLWATPHGDACYAYYVRHYTTTNMTPAQVHQLGLQQVAKIEPQLLALVHSLGYPDLKSFHAALINNPKEHAQSGQQLIDLYQHYVTQMEVKLPQMFGKLPRSKLVVVPMTAAGSSDQVPADYQAGTPDGSRPGWIRVNTVDAQKRLLTQVEAIAYHEGVPGHHLQISLAQEMTGLPEFRRFEGYTAFVEGWALYSEQLGKEAGFYTDPYSEYGRLENEMWRAVRLVVDTGVHSQHWTRDQMVQYFQDHTAMDDITIQEEVDRYIAWPGQALAYEIGDLEILKLREEAKQQLGSKFDLRAFHDELLGAGALPMNILQDRMEAWIAAQKKIADVQSIPSQAQTTATATPLPIPPLPRETAGNLAAR
ncbi:MAG TPA: DUF885 family protein [Acidobacteriaceae bacterium]|nr:DUF885 family protein [Acidobacteriaceae bacterium]